MNEPSRKDIWKMFDAISPTYDRVNRVMTSGIDRYWRSKMAQFLPEGPINLLDLATGTADQLISLVQKAPHIQSAIGTDLAVEMLNIGRQKIAKKKFNCPITLQRADAMELPFEAGAFQCATMSFGIRNVMDVEVCLREIHRILSSKGRVLILEGTVPPNHILRAGYLFYMRQILPRIGGFFSKNKEAYSYLNKTIESFPSGSAFLNLMAASGFKNLKAIPMTFGSATIYSGDKE